MTYRRVIPRDLFNEADLLKMLGKFWLRTEGYDTVSMALTDDGAQGFLIDQDPADGSIFPLNIRLTIKNKPHYLYRPLNTREPWSLWITDGGGELDEKVFDLEMGDTEGNDLSEAILTLIGVYDDDCEEEKGEE